MCNFFHCTRTKVASPQHILWIFYLHIFVLKSRLIIICVFLFVVLSLVHSWSCNTCMHWSCGAMLWISCDMAGINLVCLVSKFTCIIFLCALYTMFATLAMWFDKGEIIESSLTCQGKILYVVIILVSQCLIILFFLESPSLHLSR